MKYLYIIMSVLLIISVIFDRDKTWKAIRRGTKKLLKILPNYLKILVLLALILLFSEDFIVQYLGGQNILLGSFLAIVIGSIAMIPGFISYTLSGRKKSIWELKLLFTVMLSVKITQRFSSKYHL